MDKHREKTSDSRKVDERYLSVLEEEVDRLEEQYENLLNILEHLDSLNLKIGISSFLPFITEQNILDYINDPESGWKLVEKHEDYLGIWETYRNNDKFVKIVKSKTSSDSTRKNMADAFAIIYQTYCERENNNHKLKFLVRLIKGGAK